MTTTISRSPVSAIPTTYNGVTFRSRLEARWAVFFDAFGFRWEYEPEAFQTEDKSERYLPDFYIPNAGECEGGPSFFEVKPMIGTSEMPERSAILKARMASRSGTPVIICVGAPSVELFPGETWQRVSTPFWEMRSGNGLPCRRYVGVDFGMPHFLSNDPWSMYYEMDADERAHRSDHNFWHPDLIASVVAANNYRFWEPRNG